MTVRLYTSTDASAPTLTGQAGSLNALLYACLVTGYGTQTAAGWTRPYNDAGSNTAAFRQPGRAQAYLQSADGGPGAGSYREARWRGYATMSAYNAGTEPFPTAAQMANGLFVRKSDTLDTTARPWILLADENTFHLIADFAGTGATWSPYSFGAMTSWKLADPYDTLIAARAAENTATISSTQSPHHYRYPQATNTTCAYLQRSYDGVTLSKPATYAINDTLTDTTTTFVLGGTGQAYPHPTDGGLHMSPIYVRESAIVRGILPGLWCPAHARPLLNADTFSTLDGATTRDFQAQNLSATGQLILETSTTWTV